MVEKKDSLLPREHCSHYHKWQWPASRYKNPRAQQQRTAQPWVEQLRRRIQAVGGIAMPTSKCERPCMRCQRWLGAMMTEVDVPIPTWMKRIYNRVSAKNRTTLTKIKVCRFAYPSQPRTTFFPKGNLPCRFQRLKVLVGLEKGPHADGVEEPKYEKESENICHLGGEDFSVWFCLCRCGVPIFFLPLPVNGLRIFYHFRS